MSDMTRARAISELNQIYGMLSPDKQRALDVAINSLKIDEQYDLNEQVEPTGWIPVSERLPEQGKDHYVLVTVRHKNPTYKGHDVCIAEYDTRDDECEWKFETGWNDPNLYVSAWMPLPEPYKAESEDA